MTLTIEQEPANSVDARVLLQARDEENFGLYPPEARFAIPADKHDADGILFVGRTEPRSAVERSSCASTTAK